jgi:RimJ/RimL family protein N-acetyltransferase
MSEQIVEALSQRFPWSVKLVRDYQGLQAGSVVGWSSYLELSTHDARVEIGSTAYAPGVWRSAVNTETKLLLLGHAFDDLGFGRVQLKTDIRNVRSQRGIEGIGAKREGVLRSYQRRLDRTLRDTTVYSITRDEWPEVRRRLLARLASHEAS